MFLGTRGERVSFGQLSRGHHTSVLDNDHSSSLGGWYLAKRSQAKQSQDKDKARPGPKPSQGQAKPSQAKQSQGQAKTRTQAGGKLAPRSKLKEKTLPSLIQTGESSSLSFNLGHFLRFGGSASVSDKYPGAIAPVF